VRRTGGDVAWTEGRDIWYHEAMADASAECEPEPMDAEDPLFILYTSGSTGKPKGVLHTTGGYLVFAAMTHKYTFDYQTARSTGAPPTSAGSPATPTSSTARWPTAPSR
jgi:acetyl-CoA synthetase